MRRNAFSGKRDGIQDYRQEPQVLSWIFSREHTSRANNKFRFFNLSAVALHRESFKN